VIAGKGEGPEDLLTDGEGGYPVPVRSPEPAAGIIAEVLDDPAKAAATGTSGRSNALELSRERNARLTLGVRERFLAAAP
jgi:glycosyltransferase involved in cell wall biosynthesis